MATTPFASRGTGALIIRNGDVIAGSSATGGAGGDLTLEGGDATAATNTDGGDVLIRPGAPDGSGILGAVRITNNTGTEDDPIVAFGSASGNSHTIYWRVGTVQPNSDSVPATAGGDLYVRSDGSVWIASGAGTGNWSQVGGDWANVLSIGAASGGTDPILSSGDVFRGVDTSGTNAGAMAIRGGDGTGTADGGAVTIDGGDAGTTGGGGTVTITGGSGGTSSGDAGRIILVPPVATSGANGYVAIDASVGVSDIMLRLDRAGGASGSVSDFYVGQTTPSHTAKAGSIYLKNDETTATGGTAYVQVDASGANGTGSTWTDLTATGGGGGASAGETGIQYEGLVFYADAGNRSSYSGSGTTWTDLIGDTDGTMTDVTVTDGFLRFNGTTGGTSKVDFGTVPTSAVDVFDGGGTVYAWIRPENAGEFGSGRFLSTAASDAGWEFYVTSVSGDFVQIRFTQYFSGLDGSWRTTNTIVPLNQWSHVAVVYDNGSGTTTGGTPSLYVNGVLQPISTSSNPSGTRNSDSANNLYIGADSASSFTFQGDIQSAFFYTEAHTEAEVLRNYNATNKYLRPDIIGFPASNNQGQSLVFRAGDTASTSLSDNGGDITIQGGVTSSTSFSGDARGGNVFIYGGGTDTGATGTADGGSIVIEAATPESDGSGGSVTIRSGSGGTGGSSTIGGDILIEAGDGVISNLGGDVTIRSGASFASGGSASSVLIEAGDNTGNGTGGPLTLNAGSSTTGNGGLVAITAGSAGFGDTGGDITLTSGDLSSTAGTTGDINLTVPTTFTPSTTNKAGGSITLTAGTTGTSNQNGGDVNLVAGDTFGFNQRFGGTINLTAGDENNGSSISEGGSIVMTPGTSVSGTDGRVKIQGTGTLEFLERTSALSIPAGRGYVWVRSNTPNALMFTDDAGTDWRLNPVKTTDDPDWNDDTTNYPEGTQWINTTYDAAFVCLDNTNGAAHWQQIAKPWVYGAPVKDCLFLVNPADPNCDDGSNAFVRNLADTTNTQIGSYNGSTVLGDNAWSFNGTEFSGSGDIDFATDTSLDNFWSGGGTLFAWFKADSDGEGNFGRIICKESSGGTGWALFVLNEEATTGRISIQFQAPSDGSNYFWRVEATQGIGDWVCIAITWDKDTPGTAPLFYTNGRLRDDITGGGSGTPFSDAAYNLKIGNRPGDARTFDGLIGACALYGRELSGDEIQRFYASTRPLYREDNEELVDYVSISSAVTTIDFGGFESKEGDFLRLKGRIIGTGSASIYSWSPVGITTNQSAEYAVFNAAPSTTSTMAFAAFAGVPEGSVADRAMFDCVIDSPAQRAATGSERHHVSNCVMSTSGTNPTRIDFAAAWNETSTDFDTLRVTSSLASGLGVGSYIALTRERGPDQ